MPPVFAANICTAQDTVGFTYNIVIILLSFPRMPPGKKKTQKADPIFTLRTLAVINKIRNQKQRPSIERVVAHLVHSYGLSEPNVIKELNLSVKAGLVMKYIG